MDEQNSSSTLVDEAVAQGGAYEVIRKRLSEQGRQLQQQTQELNQARLLEFGSSDMAVTGRVRVRTENNCIARDMVQVGEHLLFGYNVFIGLKKETSISDVFALFSLNKSGDNYEMQAVPEATSFLGQASFINDFDELYRYYKHTKLVELVVKDGKLLAGFQIGEKLDDLRVFRWSVSADGATIQYIDNRGERDIQAPPAYDFEWHEPSRDDAIHGRHPHISIRDKVFVETVGGDLTIKVEDNTEDGLGIYRETVEDKTQSLDDAQIFFAEVAELVLLKIRPYREEKWRYFIYNCLTETVLRMDAIGQSCVQLPEDHGIIFPGGYYLQTGEHKAFDEDLAALSFKEKIKSPNGEDILYVFYEPREGVSGLFAYNLIEKQLQNPIFGHGHALAEDGQLVIFSAESEPTRVHPMQIWQTPYVSAEFASQAPASQSFYGRVGNAELVRGVSDLYSLCRMVNNQTISMRLYEELSKSAQKTFDDHYWLSDTSLVDLKTLVGDVSATAELVIDEFEKVQSIRQQSAKTMAEAEEKQEELLRSIRVENWEVAEEYVNALSQIRQQRGHLVTIKDYRYIDLERIAQLDQDLSQAENSLSQKTVDFLSNDKALEPYLSKIEGLDKEVDAANSNAELQPLLETIEATAAGLDLLSELMSTLKVDDAVVRTSIIEAISEVYAKLNQSRATARIKQKGLGSSEAMAQFGAQFKLFSQSIANGLSLSDTPEKCDEQLSRLLVQLEEMESQFSDFDQFLNDIMGKREEVYESFESHKQQLMDEQQRKAQSISDAANRMLSSIEKRSLKFTEADELNTYFASDALTTKVRELVVRLTELGNAVKADDLDSRYKAIKEQALRSLRDKTDIYEDGGNVIKLGPRHKFSVNTQELDITIIPRDGVLNLHLTGTDFFEPIENAELKDLKAFWEINSESESDQVYRGEYLASLILQAAGDNTDGLSAEVLHHALLDADKFDKLVRDFASPRYKEAYQKGVHDHDASLILQSLVPAMDSAELLSVNPGSRGLAQIFWANIKNTEVTAEQIDHKTWAQRAQSAQQMKQAFNSNQALELLQQEVQQRLQLFLEDSFARDGAVEFKELQIASAAKYLVAEMSREKLQFISSKYARELLEELKRSMDSNSWKQYQHALKQLQGHPCERWNLSKAWLEALLQEKIQSQPGDSKLNAYIPEAIAILNAEERTERRSSEAELELSIAGLLGEHDSIQDRGLSFSLDGFLQRLDHHRHVVVPAYHRYLQLRQDTISLEREKLRLQEFKARPLSSFVRNRLINESYLPLIGDNLAKQMGAIGKNKRTDLMGLLMMISPPGYGKTTLMEYVASRLGLIFMKINCPSLGHDVLSLDPAQAPNATAKQELNKLNLALEMGNNVMLYLDDIQHTHPEFLQKFISLCDGTRRVEGVWKGKTKTYDMRGRKFCVVMAGNPYTESGEAFKIPDMLANRADIYNLGDILGGMDEQFSLSYIENSLTSNPVLAPLAVREMGDVYKLIDMAKGLEIASTDLSHQYSGAEINEITEIFKKMLVVQEVVLKINQQYIASAAQNDKFRNEPVFKLQGSYRNMNKMTEKISAVMNQDELMQMIADHYLGESQLLTTGAEDNLLKLAELRGDMNEAQQQRWAQIKKEFLRNKAMGGGEGDVGTKVVAQLNDLVGGVDGLAQQLGRNQSQVVATQTEASTHDSRTEEWLTANTASTNLAFEQLSQALKQLATVSAPTVEVINQPVPGLDNILGVLADTIENSIYPLVRAMDKKIDIDLGTHDKMQEISQQLRALQNQQVGE